MNLITDPWIPVIRKEGPDKIRPWEITDSENPVLEINAPRPDFQGALYQFLIGLLQTCLAPEDEAEWLSFWETPPAKDKLQSTLEKETIVRCFNLTPQTGPAFMQDFNLPDGECKNIATLLIESPGGKTIKDNLDLFIKRDLVNVMCPSCAVTALFTLQINAPAGGLGNRVGLRGGGPLTTLILDDKDSTSLWKKLWLNVLNREEQESPDVVDAAVFPWMSPTRTSDKKGVTTTPADVHSLQAFWSMPRRIRLLTDEKPGICDICSMQSDTAFRKYKAKNYGTNYGGAWVHPLTPYRFDLKKKEPPLSFKGQEGGLGYRDWLGLVLHDPDTGYKAADIVTFFNSNRGRSIQIYHTASLWCFGYDMDKMKARCWYDTHFPLFNLSEKQRRNVVDWAGEFICSAKETIKILRSEIKSAWYKRPKDVKGDMGMVDQHFWEQTEVEFFQLIGKLIPLPEETRIPPFEIYHSWLKIISKTMFATFDAMTLCSAPEKIDLKRIIESRNSLSKIYFNNKLIKSMYAKSKKEENS